MHENLCFLKYKDGRSYDNVINHILQRSNCRPTSKQGSFLSMKHLRNRRYLRTEVRKNIKKHQGSKTSKDKKAWVQRI